MSLLSISFGPLHWFLLLGRYAHAVILQLKAFRENVLIFPIDLNSLTANIEINKKIIGLEIISRRSGFPFLLEPLVRSSTVYVFYIFHIQDGVYLNSKPMCRWFYARFSFVSFLLSSVRQKNPRDFHLGNLVHLFPLLLLLLLLRPTDRPSDPFTLAHRLYVNPPCRQWTILRPVGPFICLFVSVCMSVF